MKSLIESVFIRIQIIQKFLQGILRISNGLLCFMRLCIWLDSSKTTGETAISRMASISSISSSSTGWGGKESGFSLRKYSIFKKGREGLQYSRTR